MDRLYPQHVPVYNSSERREQLWQRCADRGDPVVAVRDATRGFIVRYDLQHLEVELTESALRELRTQTEAFRTYPTGTDPLSQSECVGGEAGVISGDLHTHTEDEARDLASQLSDVVFDRSNWRTKRGT